MDLRRFWKAIGIRGVPLKTDRAVTGAPAAPRWRFTLRFFVAGVGAVLVALLAALIPSLLRSRISSNEASAIASLRTLVTSQEQYKTTDGQGRYANLRALNVAMPPFIDAVLSSGRKSGYSFVGATDAGTNYTFHAVPLRLGKTGNRRFFTDSSGVIRFNASGDATSGPHIHED